MAGSSAKIFKPAYSNGTGVPNVGVEMKKVLSILALAVIFSSCSGPEEVPYDYVMRYVKHDPNTIMLTIFEDGETSLFKDGEIIRSSLTEKEMSSLYELTRLGKLNVYKDDHKHNIIDRTDQIDITIKSDAKTIDVELSETNSSSQTKELLIFSSEIITRIKSKED